jgi:predicted PurR-regulated permease PerM
MKAVASTATGRQGLATRGRGKLLALFVGTLLAVYLCWRLIAPFLPAIALATSLALITHRPMEWMRRHWQYSTLTAGFGTAAVALAFLMPAGAMTYFAVLEIGDTITTWRTEDAQRQWRQFIEQSPQLHRLWAEASRGLQLEEAVPRILDRLHDNVTAVVEAAAYIVTQGLLTLFFLFFLYRDESTALNSVRRLMPLGDRETDDLFHRLGDTVHATIFGTVLVALIQGALGGTIFAILGIPGAVLWGIIMGALSIIPYLGSFVIWGPTALILATQGQLTKAFVLTGWGLVAIGLIDNLLYPMLVGHRLKQHTAVAFIAILGGVAVFGVTGVVLGPVLMTTTVYLLEVWRQRTSHGAAAEQV